MTAETTNTTRQRTRSVAHTRRVLSLTIAFGALLPLLGTLILRKALPSWQAVSLPIHSTVEVMGAVFGLILAMVLLFSRQHNSTTRRLLVACALISIGVLDILHSCVSASPSFVWLHSIALLAGGIFFAGAWLPKRKISRQTALFVATAVSMGAILIGTLSILYPDRIPAMVVNGESTLTNIVINLTGGGLTLLGGAAFAWFYYQREYVEDLVFLLICFLFGTAGLLFHYSDMWHADWWFWHALRLAGYMLTLWLAVFAYRAAEEKKIRHQTDLAMAIAQGDFSIEIAHHDDDAMGIALHSMTLALSESQQLRDEMDWLQTASVELDNVMRGEKELSQLCTDIITCLARQLDVPIGTLSLADHANAQLILAGSFAYTQRPGAATSFPFGAGLIGQAAQEKKRILVNEVPKDYLTLSSTLGERTPASILCAPFLYEGKVAGVIELGSLKAFTDLQLRFLDQTVEPIAIAIHSAQFREKIQLLLEESQKQAEELQTQQEELRVSNEELTEKTEAFAKLLAEHEEERRGR